MMREQHYADGIKYDKRIVINRSGEYVTEYQAQKVVQSASFDIPIPNITKYDLLRELLYPDLFTFTLLTVSFIANVIFTGTLIGLSPFDPNMIVFWGIFNFILTTTRWSYTGPYQYAARLKVIEEELMKGKIVVDFKFSGLIASLILIVIGISLS